VELQLSELIAGNIQSVFYRIAGTEALLYPSRNY
jgi:hypothetical protein